MSRNVTTAGSSFVESDPDDPFTAAGGDVTAALRLVTELLARHRRIAFAESCTGGLISKLVTDVPGCSQVFWGSLVTYDNAAKERLLGVRAISSSGAVSAEVAAEMARGVLAVGGVEYGIGVTGIAGPGGGTPAKPVGTVFVAVSDSSRSTAVRALALKGSRERIRFCTAVIALRMAYTVVAEKDIDSDPMWNYI